MAPRIWWGCREGRGQGQRVLILSLGGLKVTPTIDHPGYPAHTLISSKLMSSWQQACVSSHTVPVPREYLLRNMHCGQKAFKAFLGSREQLGVHPILSSQSLPPRQGQGELRRLNKTKKPSQHIPYFKICLKPIHWPQSAGPHGPLIWLWQHMGSFAFFLILSLTGKLKDFLRIYILSVCLECKHGLTVRLCFPDPHPPHSFKSLRLQKIPKG